MKFLRRYRPLRKGALLFLAALLVGVSFLSAWFFQSNPSVGHQRNLLERHIHNQERDAKALVADTALLRRLVSRTQSEAEFKRICNKPYGLFLFAETLTENQDVLFWNSQEIIPPQANFQQPDSTFFLHLLNGYYVISKTKVSLPGISSNLMAYVLIPVLNKFYLESVNSQTQFAHSKDAVRKIAIAELGTTDFPVHSLSGNRLFYVAKAAHGKEFYADPVTLVLRLMALALLLVNLHLVVQSVRMRRGPWPAILLLASALVALRLALYFFLDAIGLRQLRIFDPMVYGADPFNRSLGDLFITTVLLCWLMLFAWASFGPPRKLPAFLNQKLLLAAGVGTVALLIFTTFQVATVVHNLVTASKISFNVTHFFSLDVYSVYGFVVLALLALTYYYFSQVLFRFIRLAIPNLLHIYLAVAVVGLVFLTLWANNRAVLFQLPVLVWLVLYTLLLSRDNLLINRIRINAAGILFWIFVFSVSLALLVMQGNAEREWLQRRAIAETIENRSDPTRERSLAVVLTSLDSSFLLRNFHRFYQQPGNQLFRDSIFNSNMLGYASTYFTDFYVFDAAGQPVNNTDARTYDELNNVLESQSKPTGITDLLYYETGFDRFSYITRRYVVKAGKTIGTIFIVATPKQFQNSDALYPNLFVRKRQDDLEAASLYSYALYKDRKLINHSNRYNFPTLLRPEAIPEDEVRKRENGDNDELWFRGSNGRVVVLAKKKDTLIEGITLFSYLFCAFLFMVALLRLAALLVRFARQRQVANVLASLNIRTQIHGTIILISVISFLIIGAATISFFVKRFNRSNVERLQRVTAGTVKEMQQKVQDDSLLVNNAIVFSDSATLGVLRNHIREIADVHGVIVNLYDLAGTLKVTSDNIIYERGVLSTKMHPNAFFELNNRRSVQWVQPEKAGQLDYNSIYTAIRNTDGVTYAYLNIPSFTSEIELNQEISNFLVTIMNLNAFIFLLAGVIALFITNRITHSFSVIGNKMKAITLGRTAEEIVWNKKDEIGELVKQYNRMVHQLEQSAAALAKSEREGAWREMARQVAHEIKNPLTPMKLSIQYLQRAIQANHPNVQELTGNVANTLIEQIDHLSKIAADFSQFANIANKKPETIDLHTVLASLVDLYSANPSVTLRWDKSPHPLHMLADKTHMNRLFTNLLTNAVDACPAGGDCAIVLNEETHGGYVVVSIADNGEGIPQEMRRKIFTPNFTTKTSGTGLGLAMCKSIVEQAGGSIWFETKEGVGTTFFVRLPLQG